MSHETIVSMFSTVAQAEGAKRTCKRPVFTKTISILFRVNAFARKAMRFGIPACGSAFSATRWTMSRPALMKRRWRQAAWY